MAARSILREKLGAGGMTHLVEPFDPERFNSQSTIAENLIFGTPLDDTFSLRQLGSSAGDPQGPGRPRARRRAVRHGQGHRLDHPRSLRGARGRQPVVRGAEPDGARPVRRLSGGAEARRLARLCRGGLGRPGGLPRPRLRLRRTARSPGPRERGARRGNSSPPGTPSTRRWARTSTRSPSTTPTSTTTRRASRTTS